MLLWIGALLFLFGLAGLAFPAIPGINSRWRAAALSSFGVCVAVIGAPSTPDAPNDPDAGIAVTMIWVSVCVACALGRMAFDTKRLLAGKTPRNNGFILRWAEHAAAITARQQEERKAAAARIAEVRRVASEQGALTPSAPIAYILDPDDDDEDWDDPRWVPGDGGETATFTYVDADGVVTDRRITNWRSEGPCIKGFCLTRKQTRTFRKDRIEDWSE